LTEASAFNNTDPNINCILIFAACDTNVHARNSRYISIAFTKAIIEKILASGIILITSIDFIRAFIFEAWIPSETVNEAEQKGESKNLMHGYVHDLSQIIIIIKLIFVQ